MTSKPAQYELVSIHGIKFGSFSSYERAVEYRDALWRLCGLVCDVVDNGASK